MPCYMNWKWRRAPLRHAELGHFEVPWKTDQHMLSPLLGCTLGRFLLDAVTAGGAADTGLTEITDRKKKVPSKKKDQKKKGIRS